MFVSGFVATERKWLKFEEEWADLLVRYQIRSPFHMNDFASGTKQYACWKDNKAKRRAFLVDAVHILKRRTNKSFSVGIVPRDLEEVNCLYETPSVYRHPYLLCGTRVVTLIGGWAKRRFRRLGRPEPIKFFFERGDFRQHDLEKELKAFDPGMRPMFRDKSLLPLQSADFVAWLHARAVKYDMGTAHWGDVLELFETLYRKLPNERSWEFMTKEAMLRTCERRGWPRRA